MSGSKRDGQQGRSLEETQFPFCLVPSSLVFLLSPTSPDSLWPHSLFSFIRSYQTPLYLSSTTPSLHFLPLFPEFRTHRSFLLPPTMRTFTFFQRLSTAFRGHDSHLKLVLLCTTVRYPLDFNNSSSFCLLFIGSVCYIHILLYYRESY